MQIKKGQKRPKVFTLELITFSNSDENDTTLCGIFSTVAKAKRFLKQKLDKSEKLKERPISLDMRPAVQYYGTNEKEGFGYRIVKFTVDGRLEK